MLYVRSVLHHDGYLAFVGQPLWHRSVCFLGGVVEGLGKIEDDSRRKSDLRSLVSLHARS
jgi:hypothetical protein